MPGNLRFCPNRPLVGSGIWVESTIGKGDGAIMFQFKQTAVPTKLNVAFWGPSGAGKTYTALALAHQLGHRIAVLDTEHLASALYAEKFPALSAEVKPPFGPERFIEGIHDAERAGFDVLIIDSLSPEWDGIGGCLDQVATAQKSGKKGAYAWLQVTPQHEALMAAINQSAMSIIVTLREKPLLNLDDANKGKAATSTPRPIMRDRFEYEYDLVFRVDNLHRYTATKSRIEAIPVGDVFKGKRSFLQQIRSALYPDTVQDVAPSAAL